MSGDESRPVAVPDGFRVGRWRVTGYLGSGSWGSVYSGEAVEGDDGEGDDGDAAVAGEPEQVALKFLPPAGTPGRRALLSEVVDRERRFSASVAHPALIRTIAVETADGGPGGDLDGATVLVMEKAVGNLRQLLGSGAPVPDGPRILAEVCAALAHMHDAGWVHGDVKPGNVLIMADGSARLADFGVTTELDGTHAYAPRIGSSDYLPPEWWSEQVGDQGIALRPTADVWAFGVLAHQVLTGGRHPFAGAAPQARAMNAQAYARTGEGLAVDDRVGEPWRSLIKDCLTPDHAGRSAFPARDLAERIAGGTRSPEPAPRRRLLTIGAQVTAIAAVAVAVVLAAVAAIALRPDSSAKSGAAPPTPAPAGVATASGASDAVSGSFHGELRPDADVPAQYRDAIRQAGHACPTPEVTPALIAAVLKVESGFDPKFADAGTDSYGIAGWTPRVFKAWSPKPGTDYMNPTDAIMAAGQYLCWIDEEFTKQNLPGDRAALTVAGYDTSTKAVTQANGVPANAAGFTKSVLEYARQYGS